MTREHLNGETINIACGRRTSVNQLLNILKNIMGSKVLPIYQERRKGDVRDSLADIQKGKQVLNYEPQVEIEAGLKRTVEYFQRLRARLPANKR